MKSTTSVSLPALIGVIHLPPLVGAIGSSKSTPVSITHAALKRALSEAKILESEGFDGIIIENFGDAPFYKDQVPAETVASMAVIASALKQSVKIPLGINVLRNDAHSALAVAAVSGAQFIRVNVLSGVVATDQGIIEGKAALLLRERERLNAGHIQIMADIDVKHGVTLSSKDPLISIEENVGRGGASAIILTGATTGRFPSVELLEQAVKGKTPVYIGSGLTADGILALKVKGIRAIVGSSLRQNNKAGNPLNLNQIRKLVKAWKKYRISDK